MIGRAAFLQGGAAVLTAAPFSRKRDDGWHHVHGPNGLSIATNRPLDLQFAGIDGRPIALAALRGKIVVVNLFATWCGPCRDEAPDFRGFASAHPDDTVVLGVDAGEDVAKTLAFQTQSGIAYALARDPDRAVVDAIGMTEYPTTLFVRPDGRLACAFVGQMTRDALEAERAYAATPVAAGMPPDRRRNGAPLP